MAHYRSKWEIHALSPHELEFYNAIRALMFYISIMPSKLCDENTTLRKSSSRTYLYSLWLSLKTITIMLAIESYPQSNWLVDSFLGFMILQKISSQFSWKLIIYKDLTEHWHFFKRRMFSVGLRKQKHLTFKWYDTQESRTCPTFPYYINQVFGMNCRAVSSICLEDTTVTTWDLVLQSLPKIWHVEWPPILILWHRK